MSYTLYGVVPSDHKDDNSDTPDDQRVGNTLPLYETDDKDEALAIYRAGGFERDGQWLAITWAKDNDTGATIGAVPGQAEPHEFEQPEDNEVDEG